MKTLFTKTGGLKLVIMALAVIACCITLRAGIFSSSNNSASTGTNGLSTNAISGAAPKKIKLKPFHGKITAWDTNTMQLTVSAWIKHVFLVTPATKITKNNEPATTNAVVVGETLVGQYAKSDDGKLVAISLHLRGKEAAKSTAETEPPKTGK